MICSEVMAGMHNMRAIGEREFEQYVGSSGRVSASYFWF